MEPGPDSGRETVVTVLLGVWYEISDINGFYFLLGMVCMIVFFAVSYTHLTLPTTERV